MEEPESPLAEPETSTAAVVGGYERDDATDWRRLSRAAEPAGEEDGNISSDDDGEFEALTAGVTDPVKYHILRSYVLRVKRQGRDLRQAQRRCEELEKEQQDLLHAAHIAQRELDRSNLYLGCPALPPTGGLQGPADHRTGSSTRSTAKAARDPRRGAPLGSARAAPSSTLPVPRIHWPEGQPGDRSPLSSTPSSHRLRRVDSKVEVVELAEDEFDDADPADVAAVPYERVAHAAPAASDAVPWYRFGAPTATGKVTPLFPGGMLYKIVAPDGSWSFYNDTMKYEMRVSFVFSAASTIVQGPRTHVTQRKRNERKVRLSVFPGRTEVLLAGGVVNGFRNYSTAVPLPADYVNHSIALASVQWRQELQQIASAAEQSVEELTDEVALCMCVESRLPFVDPAFPPDHASLFRAGVDEVPMCALPWRRPAEYLAYLARQSPPGPQGLSTQRRRSMRSGPGLLTKGADPRATESDAAAGPSRSPADTAHRAPVAPPAVTLSSSCRLFRGRVLPEDVGFDDDVNAYLVSAVAALAELPMVVRRLFRHPVSIAEGKQERRVHAYRVTLSHNGWWRTVVVDDYLPASLCGPLSMLCPSDLQKLWVPLLEKAYAKAYGSYAAIADGEVHDALVDLLGLPTFHLGRQFEAAQATAAEAAALFRSIEEYLRAGYLVLISTPAEAGGGAAGGECGLHVGGADGSDATSSRSDASAGTEDFYRQTGLLRNMSYTVLRVVEDDASATRLLKLRNPWFSSPWSKGWSFDDPRWDEFPTLRQRCGVDETSYADGVWISWADAVQHFDSGVVCFTPRQLQVTGDCGLCSFDYISCRIRGAFHDGVPSVALRVTVRTAATVYLLLAQEDPRGTRVANRSTAIQPLMLCVAKQTTYPPQAYAVDLCSSTNPNEPRTKFGFASAREVFMKYEFAYPSTSYYVIPRIYGYAAALAKPFVVGMLMDRAAAGAVDVSFVALPAHCRAFSNARKFTTVGSSIASCEYQVQLETGQLRTRTGSKLLYEPAAGSSAPPS